MKVHYCLRRDVILREDGVLYIAYGLDAVDADGRILRSVPDLLLDRHRVMDLIDRCNALELSLIHLDDVIEDLL